MLYNKRMKRIEARQPCFQKCCSFKLYRFRVSVFQGFKRLFEALCLWRILWTYYKLIFSNLCYCGVN